MSAASSEPLLLCPHSLVDPPAPGRDPRRAMELQTASPYREVLACVDGSELGIGVVPHAEIVARALGSRLTLLRVLESESGDAPADPLDWDIRRREATAQLDALATRFAGQETEVRAKLIQGQAAEQICRWAEQHDVDLTVLCSHGAHGVTDWSLASTARKLIERVPGSLFLVPAAAALCGAAVRYERILVPLDGSQRSESVVPVAMRIAANQSAEVVLVHVVPAPEITRTGPLDAEGAELESRVVEHNRRVAGDYLDRIRARVGQAGCRVRAIVVSDGSVRTRLESLIHSEEADLVLMAAHGHTGRTESPFGNVAEYVITHTTTPLLVLRDRARHEMRRVGPASPRPPDRVTPSGLATL